MAKKTRKRPALVTLSHDIRVSKPKIVEDGVGDVGNIATPLSEQTSASIERFPESVISDFSSTQGNRKRFGIQRHTKGEGVHTDVRHDIDGEHYRGFTVFNDSLKTDSRFILKEPGPVNWINYSGPYNGGEIKVVEEGSYRVLAIDEHRLLVEYYDVGEYTGKWVYMIAHIDTKYVPIVKKIKEGIAEHAEMIFKVLSEKKEGSKVGFEQLETIVEMTVDPKNIYWRSEIAEKAGLSKQTVYEYQKELKII
jgi:hypothetical protein